jgi:O-methyltransferase involved in polyketide biosynthesis
MADLPPEIDTSRPHAARIYDYFLGGKDNFAADRETAARALDGWPTIRAAARENRAFLGRAVRYLAAEAGVAQFLDIGSGLPSKGNVHEVAQEVNPAARVVYVDNDPIVLAHARALLASRPEGKCAYIQADLRDPDYILNHEAAQKTLDYTRPIALILCAVLHFMPDEDQPGLVVKRLVDALPSGSYVVSSHATSEYAEESLLEAGKAYERGGLRGALRDMQEFAHLVFTGLELVPPGVVVVSEWRPQPGRILPSAAEIGMNGAVARKP